MAVIINEMEVVLETPKRPGVEAERMPPSPMATLQPFDLAVIQEVQMKREARLLAH